jgi:hypothetical protein
MSPEIQRSILAENEDTGNVYVYRGVYEQDVNDFGEGKGEASDAIR